MSSFENNLNNIGKISPKIQEYINRVNSNKETIEDFGDIPESWKKIIEDNSTIEEKIIKDNSTIEEKVLDTSEEITQIFDKLSQGAKEGLKNSFAKKVEKYVNEINSGIPKVKVFEGLPPSFVSAVEEQLQSAKESISIEGKELGLEHLGNLSQEDFAQWLQLNKDLLKKVTKEAKSLTGKKIMLNPIENSLSYYNLLTLRPEYRSQAIIDMESIIQKPDFDKAREYYRTTMAEEEKYSNSDSNPDWLEFNFGDTHNTEEDGMRRKGYITIDTTSLELFESKVKDVIYDLNTILPGQYNGSFKISQNLSTLINQFDNIVIHGGNEEEVEKALAVISDVLEKNGIKNEITQRGKDGQNKEGKKTSHTRLLEEKIVNNEL
jgi:hypothetical protein